MSPLLTALVTMRIDALEEVLSDDIIFEVTVRHPKSVSTEEWNTLLDQVAEEIVEGAVGEINRALGAGSVAVAAGRSGVVGALHMDTIEVRVRLTPDAVKGMLMGLRSMAVMNNLTGE